ncbi:Cytochrome P450 [Streptantibioticus cattleyicolor NRRL 8057 = DSM 46488]|uniref:ferredoxin n=1 Tax=Streptomyces sp. SID5468 TaxID=2690295 RepID=UPI000213FFEE|nr:ferredoxin [Streptantibioticus cattleyicolor]CCB78317.1 Cytochrome P450 [Streptantibioticus cattleyicolor NRRL 8057 = DSM 46488]
MNVAWRVEVDEHRCIASGMCAGLAPELFELDGAHARVLRGRIEPDETALDAADSCPMSAITVRDGDSVVGPRP